MITHNVALVGFGACNKNLAFCDETICFKIMVVKITARNVDKINITVRIRLRTWSVIKLIRLLKHVWQGFAKLASNKLKIRGLRITEIRGLRITVGKALVCRPMENNIKQWRSYKKPCYKQKTYVQQCAIKVTMVCYGNVASFVKTTRRVLVVAFHFGTIMIYTQS